MSLWGLLWRVLELCPLNRSRLGMGCRIVQGLQWLSFLEVRVFGRLRDLGLVSLDCGLWRQ